MFMIIDTSCSRPTLFQQTTPKHLEQEPSWELVYAHNTCNWPT